MEDEEEEEDEDENVYQVKRFFLNLLIWPVRSHLKPVIQPATAGLQEEMEYNIGFIMISKVKNIQTFIV